MKKKIIIAILCIISINISSIIIGNLIMGTNFDEESNTVYLLIGVLVNVLCGVLFSIVKARQAKHTANDEISMSEKYDSDDLDDNEEDILFAIDLMDGHEFEYFCAKLLEQNGFTEVSVTKGSGDQGVDILATKGGFKYAIQCKNYATPLSNKPIQEVTAGKIFYNCHIGVVLTNSTFTSSAQALAQATGVLLWDRQILSEFIERCYDEGLLLQLKEKILQYSADLKSTNKQYIEDLLSEEDDDDIDVKDLCSKLKKNLQVDMEFWNEMHLDFKYNLITYYTALKLNFEIKNNSGVQWHNVDGGITIKANFYDKDDNLIYIDDTYIEYEVLVKNRFSDYLFFDYEDICEAVSIQLYAYQDE